MVGVDFDDSDDPPAKPDDNDSDFMVDGNEEEAALDSGSDWEGQKVSRKVSRTDIVAAITTSFPAFSMFTFPFLPVFTCVCVHGGMHAFMCCFFSRILNVCSKVLFTLVN